jgi:superfamily II DNA/RNA helicase
MTKHSTKKKKKKKNFFFFSLCFSLGVQTRLFGNAMRELHWTKPTKVQEQAIPLALANRDIM